MITKEQIEQEIQKLTEAIRQIEANLIAHQGALEAMRNLLKMCDG